jgi:hypothetical protein
MGSHADMKLSQRRRDYLLAGDTYTFFNRRIWREMRANSAAWGQFGYRDSQWIYLLEQLSTQYSGMG